MAEAAATDPLALKRNAEDRHFHPLNHGLTSAGAEDNKGLPYQTQDFWVYYGKKYKGGDLSYLHNVLNYGLTTDDIVTAFDELPPKIGLGDAYWEWGKNQTMEKTITMEGFFGESCELVDPFSGHLENYKGEPLVVNNDKVRNGSLEGLTSDLIKVIFEAEETPADDEKIFRNVSFTVEELGDTSGEENSKLKYRVYKKGDKNCHSADFMMANAFLKK